MLNKFSLITFKLIFFLIPLFFLPFTFDIFELNKKIIFSMLIIFLFILWFFSFIFGKIPFKSVNSPLILPLILYFLLILFSNFQSIVPAISFEEFLKVFFLFIFYFLTLQLFNEEYLEEVLFSLILGAGLISLYAIFQAKGLDFIVWMPRNLALRPIGTLGNPIFLGEFLSAVLPFNLSLFLLNKNNRKKAYLYLFCLILQVAALFLTSCRGAFLAFIFSLFFYIFLIFKLNFDYIKKIAWIILIFITLGLINNFISPKNLNIKNRFEKIFTKNDHDVEARLYLWDSAFKIMLEAPVLGKGLGTLSYSYLKYRNNEPIFLRSKISIPEKVHNEFLETASSSGIFCLLILFYILTVFFKENLKKFKTASLLENKIIQASFFSSALSFWINSLFNFQTLSTEIIWYFLLALITLQGKINFKNFSFSFIFKIFSLILILYSGFYLSSLQINKGIANYHFEQALNYENFGRWHKSNLEFGLTLKYNPYNDKYWTAYGKILEKIYLKLKKEVIYKQAILSYEQASLINPLNPYIFADLGRFYKVLALEEKKFLNTSIKNYYRALSLDPYNPIFYNDLALTYIMLENYNKAEFCFKESLKIDPYSSFVNANLGIFYFEHFKFKLAKKYLRASLLFNPKNKEALEFFKKIP
ncbi:MAG: O-antigen ligase family protein [Armatimonadetes bacterium]|nr:O-antigen ligase family protein [Armatimonadota bacterium]